MLFFYGRLLGCIERATWSITRNHFLCKHCGLGFWLKRNRVDKICPNCEFNDDVIKLN